MINIKLNDDLKKIEFLNILINPLYFKYNKRERERIKRMSQPTRTIETPITSNTPSTAPRITRSTSRPSEQDRSRDATPDHPRKK